MAEKTSAALVLVLNELMYSDDERPFIGKTREWVTRRNNEWIFDKNFQGATNRR